MVVRNGHTIKSDDMPWEHVGGTTVSKEIGSPWLATILRGEELVVVHWVGVVEEGRFMHTTGNEL
jgi:hypothetical protein